MLGEVPVFPFPLPVQFSNSAFSFRNKSFWDRLSLVSQFIIAIISIDRAKDYVIELNVVSSF